MGQLRGPVEDQQNGLAKLALVDEALEGLDEGEDWAALQAARANILVQMPGERVGDYIEQAIEAYRRALKYRTPESDPVRWARTMSNFSAALRRRVKGQRADNLERALDALPNSVRRLRVAASGAFALFPPAMLMDGQGSALLGRVEIVSALRGDSTPRARNGDSESAALIAVVDPTGDLPHSRSEGRMLSALFSERTVLVGRQASKQRVIDAVRGAASIDYLHISCHGRYQWRHPERSGLVLAGGEILSLSDISEHFQLSADTVVVLPACETGLTEYRELPDESYGLALAFLSAGAGTVIGVLWPVPDQSTKLLMLRFYEAMRAGASPPAALRTAQIWLRDTPWSGFKAHVGQLDAGIRRDGELERPVGSLRLKWVRAEPPGAPSRERPFEHPACI